MQQHNCGNSGRVCMFDVFDYDYKTLRKTFSWDCLNRLRNSVGNFS